MTKLQYPLCGPQVCLQRGRMFDMPALEHFTVPAVIQVGGPLFCRCDKMSECLASL